MVSVHALAEASTVGRTFMPIMLIQGTNLQMKFQANRVHFPHVRKNMKIPPWIRAYKSRQIEA